MSKSKCLDLFIYLKWIFPNHFKLIWKDIRIRQLSCCWRRAFYSIQWHNCPRLVSMVPTICFQPITIIYVPVSYHEPSVIALYTYMLIFSFESICICHLRPFILLYNVSKVHYKLWRWSDIHSTFSKGT